MASDRFALMRPILVDASNKDFTIGSVGSPVSVSLTAGTYANVCHLLYAMQTAVRAEEVDVLTDGDMEAAGVGDWTAASSTLSKETSSPAEGSKWLKVLATAGAGARVPFASQAVGTVGRSYYSTGYGRSDGTQLPVIQVGEGVGGIIWTGTNSASWQSFSGEKTMLISSAFYAYFSVTDPAGTEFVGFDDLKCFDVTAGAPVTFTASINSSGLVVLSADTTFSLTWTDTALRDLLGFTGNLASASTYTATYTPQYCWFPSRVRADNAEWISDQKSSWKGVESRTGNVSGLQTGTTIYRTTAQMEALHDYEVIRSRATTAVQDVRTLEYFVAQSRTVWSTPGEPSLSGFYFFNDYTSAQPAAVGTWDSGDVTQFHRASSPETFAFCQFDADWYPKAKPTIPNIQCEWYDVDIDFHSAVAPDWTGT